MIICYIDIVHILFAFGLDRLCCVLLHSLTYKKREKKRQKGDRLNQMITGRDTLKVPSKLSIR